MELLSALAAPLAALLAGLGAVGLAGGVVAYVVVAVRRRRQG